MKPDFTFTFVIPNPVYMIHSLISGVRYKIELYKDKMDLEKKKRILIDEFHKLNWNDSDMWRMTCYSTSLNEAIGTLTYELLNHCKLDDVRLEKTAKELITIKFENGWK